MGGDDTRQITRLHKVGCIDRDEDGVGHGTGGKAVVGDGVVVGDATRGLALVLPSPIGAMLASPPLAQPRLKPSCGGAGSQRTASPPKDTTMPDNDPDDFKGDPAKQLGRALQKVNRAQAILDNVIKTGVQPGPPVIPILNDIVSAYQKAHPNVHIKTQFAAWTGYWQKVQTQLAD